MEKCEQCRWWHNECTNPVVDEIKEDCSYYFSYIDSENDTTEYEENQGLEL
jgi:hypothetical protein